MELIKGVLVSPLKIIKNEKGDIYHIMRNFDPGYNHFGEVYISTVKYSIVKAWKKHLKMITNFVVPIGEIKFVIYDDREQSQTFGKMNEFNLSLDNYVRLTIPSNVWYGFKGLDNGKNMLINIASIPHDPNEQINREPDFINYDW